MLSHVQLLLLLLAIIASPCVLAQLQLPQCSSENQIVMCGQLPVDTDAAVAAYSECCVRHEPFALPPHAQEATSKAAYSTAAVAATIPRPDLDLTPTGRFATPPDYLWTSTAISHNKPASSCVPQGQLLMPTFTQGQPVSVNVVTAPVLSSSQITRVKARALALTRNVARSVRRAALTLRIKARNAVPEATAVYTHPAGLPGVAELAMMQARIAASTSPQAEASVYMLSGATVPPKFYRYNASIVWNPPTDCPASWSPGPYPLARSSMKWGGGEEDTSVCPPNYPVYAPRGICGHVSFVEMDSQMLYKQALAYYTTKDERYAQNVFAVVNAWASTNKGWGMPSQNGPLEAGWGIAAMAKSLELLRTVPGFAATHTAFLTWFNTFLKPQMVAYVDVNTANAVKGGNLNIYSNWHASIAESWMAVAVLSDDAALFSKASSLFVATTTNYLRWGRDPNSSTGRVVGECTETLRDIYHSEFGLGGLLQTAEMAWQQNIDLYATANWALVAAMELHARIINAWDAGRNEALLPPGFKFFDKSMPPAPKGTQWSFDLKKQVWVARKPDGTVVSTLTDGFKYLLGVSWLPTGWEVGYNHFAGRLGLTMPETAALLKRYPVEHHEFHWGQGTLTHADTAYQLWRGGLNVSTLC